MHTSILVRALLLGAIPLAAGDSSSHSVRATGVVRAVHSVMVQVPRIEGQGGNLTLAALIENGKVVTVGEPLASFDRTGELQRLREAQAKYDDLKHQVDQKLAEHNSNAEKRASDLQSAEADLKKAEIEIRKGPVLSVHLRPREKLGLLAGVDMLFPAAAFQHPQVQEQEKKREGHV